MKIQLKKEAITLRKKGYLYSEIAQTLGIAKSTAYSWACTVQLNDAQLIAVTKRLALTKSKNVAKMALLKKQRSANMESVLRNEAARVAREMELDVNTCKVLCAVMYWCEGEKDISGGVRFINSDPLMARAFLTLLRKSFSINETKFRALVHLHDYHDELHQLQFWSELTHIPLSQFHKSYRKPHTGKRKREDYPGCISIRYGDATLGKMLKMIYSEFGKNL